MSRVFVQNPRPRWRVGDMCLARWSEDREVRYDRLFGETSVRLIDSMFSSMWRLSFKFNRHTARSCFAITTVTIGCISVI